ncbi:MAG: hypothetical protein M3Y54_12120 [Bacteroidota bacterium]|nr:hypothetical protein [Bacteroidota bacterium]
MGFPVLDIPGAAPAGLSVIGSNYIILKGMAAAQESFSYTEAGKQHLIGKLFF